MLILNGDNLFELDLGALHDVSPRAAGGGDAGVAQGSEAALLGLVEVTDRGGGAGRAAAADSAQTLARMFAGIHILHPRSLRSLPVGKGMFDYRCPCRGIQDESGS